MDSGASYHFTPRREFIRNLRLLPSPVPVLAAFGPRTLATHGGDGFIPFGNNELAVGQILFCENIRNTLLSYVLLMKHGHKIQLDGDTQQGTLLSRESSFSLRVSMLGDVLSLEQASRPMEIDADVEVNATTRGQRKQQVDPKELPDAPDHPATATGEEKQTPAPATEASGVSSNSAAPISALAHARYGHLCGRKLDQLLDNQGADGMLLNSKHPSHKHLISSCDACMVAKMGRIPFGQEMQHHVEGPNDKAVGDVCGPIKIRKVIDGATVVTKVYVSLITDVYSRHVSLMILDTKDNASQHVISYMHSSRIITGRELKHFHTDGGSEYNDAERVLLSRGVKVTRTPIHTPQHNAISERKNRTLMEMVRTFLSFARLNPDDFFQLAFEAAVITHNRVTIVHGLKKTQHELFTKQKPNLSHLRVFGCDAFVKRTTDEGKLVPRADKGIFVGYDVKREYCYRVLVGDRIVVSRDVRFAEDKFTVDRTTAAEEQPQNPSTASTTVTTTAKATATATASHPEQSDSDSEEESNLTVRPSERVDAATAKKIAAMERQEKQRTAAAAQSSRRSARASVPTRSRGVNLDDFGKVALATDTSYTDLTTVAPNFIRQSDVAIPATQKAAARSPEWPRWEAAMQAELQSIKRHGTFSLVEKPNSGVNIVGCKWVFAVKAKDGWVSRFKARLVARGFSQQYGVDFEETYSPVLKYKTLRMLLSLICARDMTLELMDVQTAYLNAPLKETVYMSQPPGLEEGGRNIVWRLHKALYGLKQSGREWHTHLNTFVLSLGFTRCVFDSCVYIKRSRTGRLIILSVYVDDIPSAFDPADAAEWEEIKQQFFAKYAIKFLGEADWFLNMRITRNRKQRLLWLDQQAYVEQLLDEFGFDDSKAVATPGSQEELSRKGAPSTDADVAAMRAVPYRKAIGMLSYLANSSRPDISHPVNYAAQYAQNPGESHWRAVKKILRYLCGTKDYALQFGGAPNKAGTVGEAGKGTEQAVPSALRAFADANWGGCLDSRRSTTGFIIAMGTDLLDWQSRKQTTVALSTCEAEYMAIAAASQALAWTRGFLREIEAIDAEVAEKSGEKLSPVSCIPILHSDNKAAIELAKNDVLHQRTKHIDIKHHFIREQLVAGLVTLRWIPTSEQLADILTKSLKPRLFCQLRDQLVVPRPTD